MADPGAGRPSAYYQCTQRASSLSVPSCLVFPGRDLDAAVERVFLGAVAAPPLPMLEQALAEARGAEATRVNAVEAERKRLQYDELVARDRYEAVDPRNTLVFEDAVKDLEKARRRILPPDRPPPLARGGKEAAPMLKVVGTEARRTGWMGDPCSTRLPARGRAGCSWRRWRPRSRRTWRRTARNATMLATPWWSAMAGGAPGR
jgi:hypothetical protein